MTAEVVTSKKEDASVVEREVTLRETVLKAEVAVADPDLHLATRIRDITAEDRKVEATHQLVAEEASMTREEEVWAAEVPVAERVSQVKDVERLKEAPVVNLLNNLELINQVNNIISQ